MTEAKIQSAIASSVVGLTRHVMATSGKPDYEAYRFVTGSELFHLLQDPRTGLFLNTNTELSALLDAEQSNGERGLYDALDPAPYT